VAGRTIVRLARACRAPDELKARRNVRVGVASLKSTRVVKCSAFEAQPKPLRRICGRCTEGVSVLRAGPRPLLMGRSSCLCVFDWRARRAGRVYAYRFEFRGFGSIESSLTINQRWANRAADGCPQSACEHFPRRVQQTLGAPSHLVCGPSGPSRSSRSKCGSGCVNPCMGAVATWACDSIAIWAPWARVSAVLVQALRLLGVSASFGSVVS